MKKKKGERKTRERYYRDKAQVIQAMAHPSRLLMIDALACGERCVCELQELVGSDITTVSKHLKLMKGAGLVEDRKEGVKVFYRLKLPCIFRCFDCFDVFLGRKERMELYPKVLACKVSGK